MITREFEVETIELLDVEGLDPIEVFFRNYGEGRGSVTITCYGSAWTAYFGAMGCQTIQYFVRGAGTDYLVSKLGNTQWLKQTKGAEKYLGKIVDAVKKALRVEAYGALAVAGMEKGASAK